MENKLIILLCLMLSLSLASAVSLSAFSEVNLNENFNLIISGGSFYAVELNIPESIVIISDESAGSRVGTLYKTVSSGETTLVLRATNFGEETINGVYSEGNGVIDINPITISIVDTTYVPVCSPCLDNTEWSNCEDNSQIRFTYSCSSATSYRCVQNVENQYCESPSSSSTQDNIIENNCDVGWICKDEYTILYQSSDCSTSSIQSCDNGCLNGACIIQQEEIEEFEDENDLDIDIAPIDVIPIETIVPSFFGKIWNFLKAVVDFLIFWN